ncbi:mitochondrial carrier [Clavulina sp. PMI_390]|nr:mitochondrial carrier [Clavulina sp. PMI_390]
MSQKLDSTHAWYAKPAAASVGATITALTMTPFDVIKTRLQTQPVPPSPLPRLRPTSSPLLFPRISEPVCCQPSPDDCVRRLHTFSLRPSKQSHRWYQTAVQSQIICLWDGNTYQNRPVRGFRDAAWQIWRIEGSRGLWKGLGPTLAIAVPSQTFYMVLYDGLLNTFMPHHPAAPLIAGITARTVITTAMSPLELLRTRLQATPAEPGHPRTLTNTLRDIHSMVRVEGLRALWRGLSTTLWRDVPFSGIYWMIYESSKPYLRHEGHGGPFVAFAGGAVSGICAAIITSPFDVLKTRRQVTGGTSSSTLRAFSQLIHDEGYRSLFTGLTPRLAKIAPACGIMIACYEGLSTWLSH